MTNENAINKIIFEIIFEIDNNIELFDDPSIENGTMGLALFYFFCHQFYEDDTYREKGEQMVEKSINILSSISANEKFNPKYRGDSLTNVIASFGKGLLYIQFKLLYGYEFSQHLDSLSDILIELTNQSLKEKDFDFFSGALSSGHFFLNRYFYTQDERSKKSLLNIYNALEKTAIHQNEDMVCWISPAYANTVYLGISHGSAMIINFLTKLFELKILDLNSVKEKQLLTKAVNFVLSQKRNNKNGFFPNVYNPEITENGTQFTMCYGDLGVLFGLVGANRILQIKNIEIEIEEIVATCIKRENDPQYTFDATIFYGASGVFCVFNELNKRYKDTFTANVSNYWYKQIITNRIFDKNTMAGFVEGSYYKENPHNKSALFSYGWGLAGIGICLMIGLKPELPLLSETLLIGI